MGKPTKEQIKAALEWSDKPKGRDGYAFEYDKQMDALAAAYRATQRPASIIGRAIGYLIAAALGVLALAGLLAAVKLLVGVAG